MISGLHKIYSRDFEIAILCIPFYISAGFIYQNEPLNFIYNRSLKEINN